MLTRWYETPALHRDLFQTLFDDDVSSFDRRLRTLWDQAQSLGSPRFSLYDNGHEVIVRGELPGMTEKDLSITVENGKLTIQGARGMDAPEGYRVLKRERLPMKFTRTLTLSKEMNFEAAEAKLENGILTLQIPKRPEAQPRQIPIKAS
jgi:HSP20 family protein